MSDLADRIAALSPAKRELLRLRLQQQGPAGDYSQAIPRRGEADAAPLSFAQQRLWFLDQLEPNSSLYNIHAAFRVQGALDRRALQAALDGLVVRHEALRTTFAAPDGQPVQVVGAPRRVPLAVVDLTDQSESDPEAACQQHLAAEVRRPFNLSRDLMLRAMLVRLKEGEHVLLVVLHHIASDGWSMGVCWRELSRLYAAAVGGRPHGLPDLPIQYADYAIWQRQWLQGDVLDAQLAYWRGRLAGAPASLELPTDRARPAVQTVRGAHRTRTLPPALHEALETFSRQAGATLFMALLAGFQALLTRYTEQEDIVVGSPIAGRTRVETEGLIGFFVNTLALRTDLTGNPPFRELLGRVREGCLEAYAHQELPFEKLVEELQPTRTLSQSPLFQVMFVLQNAPRTALALAGLTLTPFRIESGTAKFDLTLSVTATDAGLQATVEYNADLFDAATLDRFLGHYQTLLEGAVAAPDRPLSELPLLTAAERHQLFVEWNATATAYPRQACIHTLFEAQVARTPEAVAVVWDEQSLTYAELNRRANRVAHHLRRIGVARGRFVGVFMNRSPELIVALLGILKAGAAYVPLDLASPADRIAHMLQDADLAVLVTESGMLDRLPGHGAQVLCLDSWTVGPEVAEPETNPVTESDPLDLAYMMYTSGSTGRPKGVTVPHRAVVRLVKNTNYAHLTADEVFLQMAPVSFDASTLEIWGSLLNGARLVLCPGKIPSLDELAEVLDRHEVSTLWLPAGLFHQVVEVRLDALRSVRQLLAGGDVLSAPHVRKVLERFPGCCVINGYGPTENTTFTCCYPMTDPGQVQDNVSIGRPIANTQVYILDKHMQPVPIGIRGELWTGGDGLAAGYLNRPDLTVERFVPNPHATALGERLYRTGDFARYLSDGTIQFLGRSDNQVKLRGFRIELGEVEAALMRHRTVRQAVVVLRDDPPVGKRLVAYVVAEAADQYSSQALREFLTKLLPDYMIPATFVPVDVIPLTANGKVDRRALAVLELRQDMERREGAPPRELLEIRIAQIWEEILGRGPVGIHDNFFELGGHSLLAVRMIAKIEQVCGQRLPLSTLFAGGTIRHLVDALLERSWRQSNCLCSPIHADGVRRPFFFLHGDYAGGGFYSWELAQQLGSEQPFYVLHPQVGHDGSPVPYTIEEMADEYLQTVRACRPTGPYLLGGVCNGGLIAFEMASRLRAQGEQVDLVLAFDSSVRNARFPGLKLVSTLLAKAFRLSAGSQKTLLVHLQRLGSSVERRLRFYRTHPKEALRRIWRRLRGMRPPDPPALVGLDAVYRHAVAGYVPSRYPGRVTLILSAEEGAPARYDRAWRRVAKEVEVHVVPGDHLTALTQHIHAIACSLKACLDAAHRQDDHGAKP